MLRVLSMSSEDIRTEPFDTVVVMGESTVEGGPWLIKKEDRWPDVLVRLINRCQARPVKYHNRGIGANVISPRSPGYEGSAKPSAIERYREDVIALEPDLFILSYGLNDMRAGMEVGKFLRDMKTIIRNVQSECSPVTVLTTVYNMTGWGSYPPFDKGSRELTERYNQGIRTLAEQNGCILSDVWEAEGCADWLINPDGVHANFVGNLIIGHRVFRDIAINCSCLTSDTFEKTRSTRWVKNTTSDRREAGDPFTKTW